MKILKILHISDAHTDAQGLASGLPSIRPDIVVVTGDMLPLIPAEIFDNYNEVVRWQRQQWLVQAELLFQAYGAPIVAVPGNHDRCNYAVPGLCYSVDGGAKRFNVLDLAFTGLRATPAEKGLFDRELTADQIRKLVRKLNPNADILITHYPPENLPGLREWTEESDIKLHLHGHDHFTFGSYVDPHSGATISNAATGYREIEL